MMYMGLKKECEQEDIAKLELYRLIGEGYRAMQEGRTSTLDEVKNKCRWDFKRYRKTK